MPVFPAVVLPGRAQCASAARTGHLFPFSTRLSIGCIVSEYNFTANIKAAVITRFQITLHPGPPVYRSSQEDSDAVPKRQNQHILSFDLLDCP